ncbi:deubiquitinase DESI2-like isoform X2 [Natator depressus]|uniref:deubiquitinase DESI2-like isoform X2 n=1 Tax=Natator depressus TaxID=27790 RepID=UPI003EBFB51A
MANEPVILNVYDMYWINEYTSTLGIGVFHSGIEIYGRESPLLWAPLISQKRMWIRLWRSWARSTRATRTISCTRTAITSPLLWQRAESDENLMDEECLLGENKRKILCGKEIPRWVNRLAYFSSCIPFLQSCLPREWLTPAALQTHINLGLHKEEQGDTTDEESPSTSTAPSASGTSRTCRHTRV